MVSLRDYQPILGEELDEVFDGWCISSVYVVEQMAIAHQVFQLNRGIVIEVLFVEAHRHILDRVSVLNEFVECLCHFQLEVVPAVVLPMSVIVFGDAVDVREE